MSNKVFSEQTLMEIIEENKDKPLSVSGADVQLIDNVEIEYISLDGKFVIGSNFIEYNDFYDGGFAFERINKEDS